MPATGASSTAAPRLAVPVEAALGGFLHALEDLRQPQEICGLCNAASFYDVMPGAD